MPREDSSYPADWVRIAEKDLARLDTMLNAGDAEAAGFYLQQATEKMLKACLLAKGWKLRRTHNLETLVIELSQFMPEVETYRKVCQKITDFYVLERYPLSLESGLTTAEVQQARDEIAELLRNISQSID